MSAGLGRSLARPTRLETDDGRRQRPRRLGESSLRGNGNGVSTVGVVRQRL